MPGAKPQFYSTRSSSALTLLRPSVTSSLKFSDRSIAIAVPPLWNKLPPALQQLSDPFYELTKPHSLLYLHSSFTPNLKHCSSTNPILICPLPSTSRPPNRLRINFLPA